MVTLELPSAFELRFPVLMRPQMTASNFSYKRCDFEQQNLAKVDERSLVRRVPSLHAFSLLFYPRSSPDADDLS